MENEQISRKNDLEAALKARGLTLRMDSKLCYCFVTGQTGPEWDLHRVVHECSVMHWLYNYTSYPKICEDAAFYESSRNFFYSQRDFMAYMRRYVHPVIKESVIRNAGGLPEVWPWLALHENNTPAANVPVDNADVDAK